VCFGLAVAVSVPVAVSAGGRARARVQVCNVNVCMRVCLFARSRVFNSPLKAKNKSARASSVRASGRGRSSWTCLSDSFGLHRTAAEDTGNTAMASDLKRMGYAMVHTHTHTHTRARAHTRTHPISLPLSLSLSLFSLSLFHSITHMQRE